MTNRYNFWWKLRFWFNKGFWPQEWHIRALQNIDRFGDMDAN